MKEKIFKFKIFLKDKFKLSLFCKNNTGLGLVVILVLIYFILKIIGVKI